MIAVLETGFAIFFVTAKKRFKKEKQEKAPDNGVSKEKKGEQNETNNEKMADWTFIRSPVSWKPSGVCGKHGLCRRRGWIFTDEAESFEGSLEEPEENPDGGQSEDSFASVSEFTGFTSGEAEEDFSGEEDFVARIPRMGLKAKRIPRLFWNPICRMRAATFRT